MLKKIEDPAFKWALRVFGAVTALATVLFALSWVGPPGSGFFALGIFVSLMAGAAVGGFACGPVYIAVASYLSVEDSRDQRREVRRRADENRVLGRRYASIVEATRATVSHIRYSEAARSGLLGDIDFDADIRGITDNLRKAYELQKVADKLAALDKPDADDRKILEEAKTTVSKLETAALNRVELIDKCAAEAKLIDKSLHEERQDATTSAQRAELNAKLAAMLYGIEATPDTTPTDSAADAVLLRVRAYREIKNQIRLDRD